MAEDKRLLLVACEVLAREAHFAAARSPRIVDVELVTQGLHDLEKPGMAEELQRRVDAADPELLRVARAAARGMISLAFSNGFTRCVVPAGGARPMFSTNPIAFGAPALQLAAADLESKLCEYQCYYNEHRYHAERNGATPVDSGNENIVTLNDYQWKKHCRRLFQLPVAA